MLQNRRATGAVVDVPLRGAVRDEHVGVSRNGFQVAEAGVGPLVPVVRAVHVHVNGRRPPRTVGIISRRLCLYLAALLATVFVLRVRAHRQDYGLVHQQRAVAKEFPHLQARVAQPHATSLVSSRVVVDNSVAIFLVIAEHDDLVGVGQRPQPRVHIDHVLPPTAVREIPSMDQDVPRRDLQISVPAVRVADADHAHSKFLFCSVPAVSGLPAHVLITRTTGRERIKRSNFFVGGQDVIH
mmetsp:Transcript_17590/g.33395  ORF Transcript_17590/g.33395 Transcript_17590/m.33395 type:complete len:240 (+) Transcript_17590:523-1242(+)